MFDPSSAALLGVRRRARRAGAAAVAFALGITSTGCATTIIDDAGLATTTTTTSVLDIPTDSLSELGVVLSERIATLSAAKLAGDGPRAQAVLGDIEKVWAALGAGIRVERPELADQLLYDFERIIELCRTAVVRNRPADADKAVRFLPLALASLNA
jgi:hypothetical protein